MYNKVKVTSVKTARAESQDPSPDHPTHRPQPPLESCSSHPISVTAGRIAALWQISRAFHTPSNSSKLGQGDIVFYQLYLGA